MSLAYAPHLPDKILQLIPFIIQPFPNLEHVASVSRAGR
jgi:hypothetical protein